VQRLHNQLSSFATAKGQERGRSHAFERTQSRIYIRVGHSFAVSFKSTGLLGVERGAKTGAFLVLNATIASVVSCTRRRSSVRDTIDAKTCAHPGLQHGRVPRGGELKVLGHAVPTNTSARMATPKIRPGTPMVSRVKKQLLRRSDRNGALRSDFVGKRERRTTDFRE
jgi:hypothetical protein